MVACAAAYFRTRSLWLDSVLICFINLCSNHTASYEAHMLTKQGAKTARPAQLQQWTFDLRDLQP